MSNTRYFVRCSDDCLFEAMTKEQILTAITQAVETGEIKDIDSGFITTIKEANKGAGLRFWVGTTAEYEALTEKAANVLYIKTDDTTAADFETWYNRHSNFITLHGAEITKLNKKLNTAVTVSFTALSETEQTKSILLSDYGVTDENAGVIITPYTTSFKAAENEIEWLTFTYAIYNGSLYITAKSNVASGGASCPNVDFKVKFIY